MKTFQDMLLLEEIRKAAVLIAEDTETLRTIEQSRYHDQWANNKLIEMDGEIAGLRLRIRRSTNVINVAVGRLLGDGQ